MPMAAAASVASSAAGSSARPSPRASSSRTKLNGTAIGTSTGAGNTASSATGTVTPTTTTSNGTPVPGAYQGAPLSSRKAQALDMSTVERRIPGVKETPKQMRPHGLTEAPTFYPTAEEFRDPMEFIRSISETGSKYGIVKIVPPDNWTPDFGVDTERFHFRTRRQELNSVEGGTRANLNYLDQLSKYHKQHGTTLNRFPSVDKRPLDLYRLKKAVEIRGGFHNVCKHKKWAEIGRDLGYSGKIMSSLSTSLKNSYSRYLQPYEEWVKSAKPSVQQQIEAEFGGPITPSPAASPLKRPPVDKAIASPMSLGPDSPAVGILNFRNSADTPDKSDTDMGDGTPKHPITSVNRSFTPVNGGFTPVNMTPSGFTPVNTMNGGLKKEADTRFSTPNPTSRQSENGFSSKRSSPEGAGSPLKRVHQENGAETPSGKSDDGESGERRSKRLKKEPAPMVAGSHMTLHKPSAAPRNPTDRNHNKPGEKCEKCGRGDDMVKLLLCDGCDHGYHTYCLDPPLKIVPDVDWYCDRCLVGTGDYGFADGEIYSLRQFQEKANNFKDNYFQSKMPFDPVKGKARAATEDDVEREFWRLVESVHETVEVEYGADIHSTTHGSGFPTVERHPTNPYSTDPWNLTILPLHPESLFRHIKSDVSGMTVPWLYVGMCFSTFCWHNEDHYTYSANYQHFGATKTWYGIPGEDAERFENAMREAVPELFEQQPDLLFQLVTLLTPQHLAKAGVRVYALDQRAGQFVITFPKAYHAGFNHGFNFNEAVNFAPSDWEPFGQEGVERYKQFRRAPVFSHDELLLTAAGRDASIKTAQWLAPALERMKDREFADRGALLQDLPTITQTVMAEGEELTEEEYQCSVCRVYCYLSQVICSCTSNVGCPSHYRDICDCDKTKLTLRLRMSNEVLEEIVQKVRDKADVPKLWAAKLEKTMVDSPRPQLKVLKQLLSEGEKISYYIPELAPLKAFVEKCQEWVDEAMPFVSRKQQNRRKNEKVWRKGSTKAAEMEEKEKEHRSLDNMLHLLREAENLGFDCPEIDMLTERAHAIREFQMSARHVLATPGALTTANYEEMIELGKSFNVDLDEAILLEKIVKQIKWADDAREKRRQPMCLEDVEGFIKSAQELAIPDNHEQLVFFKEQKAAGDMWEAKAKELMNAESVHFQQLEALSNQAANIPISKATLAQVDQILNNQREAQRKIVGLYEASTSPEFDKRPKYKDVCEVLETLKDIRPGGVAFDLEKQQKRHEDWMRRGKKLFGKANAPLHILHQHMLYVDSRNQHCFDLEDRPRTPVEPLSREPTPERNDNQNHADSSRSRPREVFCICRQPESGMMIECEVCHEWYHGKCLKIARGRVKEDDKYTCPICDYRVRIPRDAARPKLEDLIEWQSEIPSLPFIPDELEVLDRIVSSATEFRKFVGSYTNNPLGLTSAEIPVMRFYLRKIEGAEILLAHETNFFRQELHKWMPIAPDPPPSIEISTSTRKPRPTKQQKLMAQLGIKDPADLPVQYRTKAHVFKKHKVPGHDTNSKPTPLKPAPLRATNSPTPSLTPNTDGHMRSSSSQPPMANGTPAAFSFSSQFANGPAFAQPTLGGATAGAFNSSSIMLNNSSRGPLDPALFGGHSSFGHPQVTGSSSGSPHYATTHEVFEQLANRDGMVDGLYTGKDTSELGDGAFGSRAAAEDEGDSEALDKSLADQFLQADP